MFDFTVITTLRCAFLVFCMNSKASLTFFWTSGEVFFRLYLDGGNEVGVEVDALKERVLIFRIQDVVGASPHERATPHHLY